MAAYSVTTVGNAVGAGSGINSSCFLLDPTHAVVAWSTGNTNLTQVFTIDTSTWNVTTSGASLDIASSRSTSHNMTVVAIDSSHFIGSYPTTINNYFYTSVFAINTTTWAITTTSTLTTTNGGRGMEILKIDTNHFITMYNTSGESLGAIQSYEVNTSTWAVTTKIATTGFSFDTQGSSAPNIVKIDTNHVIGFWLGTNDNVQKAQVFTINTSTWAVTTANSYLNWGGSQDSGYKSAFKIDANHFIKIYGDLNSSVAKAIVFTVNTSTWAVTTASAELSLTPGGSTGTIIDPYITIDQLDSNHFIVNWTKGTSNAWYTSTIIEINTSTWAVTTSGALATFGNNSGYSQSICRVDTNHYFTTSALGSRIFAVELPALGPANLKSYNTNLKANIKSINTNLLANIKSLDTNI